MIVLHAAARDGSLLLWGEQPGKGGNRKRGRPPRIRPSPFDAGADILARSLEHASMKRDAGDDKAIRAVAWLPTIAGKPVPSCSLINEWPEASGGARLEPWIVTARALSPGESVDLLCACIDRNTLAPGIVAGNDLRYWAEALRFAGSIVARQRYLPGVRVMAGGSWCAVWEPVYAGADHERLAALAGRMPPAARAISASSETGPPRASAVETLALFLDASVDYIVRSGAGGYMPESLSRRTRSSLPGSIHDAWLRALQSPEGGMIEWDAAELARLSDQVRAWKTSVDSAASPLRLCFRLEEPPPSAAAPPRAERSPDGPWRLRFLLQDCRDPSLIIPLEEIWNPARRARTALARHGANDREHMLASLGRAAGICPRIAASLESPAPAGYTTGIEGAYEFLTRTAPALEASGFGVMLPAWWTRRGAQARLSKRAQVKSGAMKAAGMLSLDTLVEFDWRIALGGEELTLAELQALADLKAPLVRVRGQWIEANAEEIRKALEFMKSGGSGKAAVRDIIRSALGSGDDAGGIGCDGVDASGWVGDLLRQLESDASIEEIPIPPGFSGTLRPYQVRGFSWLAYLRRWGLGACLADDMGLGKTVQALALIQRDRELGDRAPALIVCPTSVVTNWQREAARFTPGLPVMIHHGVGRKKGAEFVRQAKRHAIVLSSYGLLHRDLHLLREVPWAGVILDEAQNVKNPETKGSRAARSLGAGYRIALTGTPVENHVGDLWAVMEFLNPGFLGDRAGFRRRFFIPIQAERDEEAARRLRRITGPFILRRLKTDKTVIDDLPEKLEMKVFCTLTKEQASLYAAVLKDAEDAMDDAEGIQRKGLILAMLSKLKQVCNHPAQFLGDNSRIEGRSGKLGRLMEMLEEIIEVGDRALVFSQFAEMGEILRRHIQEAFGREALFLHGGVPRGRRDRMIERFQNDPDGPPVFVLSLKAGGTGLNLTRASHVFHFDRWWNPAVENQATDRAFRIGQTKNVQVHKFVCAGTMEEKIDEMIERKKGVADAVVGAGEAWLTELSNRELKEIFALRKEALEA